MNKLIFLTTSAATVLLTNCASFEGSEVADLNGDGVISNAEHNAYYNKKSVENMNVDTERNKRDNAVDVVRDTRNTLWNAQSIKNTLQNW